MVARRQCRRRPSTGRPNKDAPRLRIVSMDVRQAAPAIHEVVPQDKAVLEGAGIVGGKLIASYLVDVKSELRRYALDGKPDGVVALPGIGSVAGTSGAADDDELFYAFTSFATPTTIYRYDLATGTATPWAKPKVAFDPGLYEVAQRFYASKDGTKVPMFIVRRKDLPAGPAPTCSTPMAASTSR